MEANNDSAIRSELQAENLQAEISRLLNYAAIADDKNAVLSAECDRKQAELSRLRAELEAMRKRVEEAEFACKHILADWNMAVSDLHTMRAGRDAAQAEVRELREKLNTPELIDFSAAVVLEAAHQRERWTSTHDAGKEPQDWFWLLGYLAGKALKAHASGDTEKALHHTISSAAALANWHAAILGQTNMRPGISQEKQDAIAEPDGSRDKRIIREQIEEGARCPDCKELNGDCDCGNNDYVPGFDDGSPPDRDEDNTRNLGLEPRG